MAKLSSLSLDASKVEDGVWVEWENGVELLIAQMHNPAMEAYIRKRTASPRRGFRSRELTDEEMEEITKEAVATCVLLGWRNIEDDTGEPLDYTAERSIELVTDPKLRHLYRFVVLTASDQALYMASDVGN